MITKNKIVLAFLMLFTTVSLAQTKEETLEWFKDFGEKLANTSLKCTDADYTLNFEAVLNDEFLIINEIERHKSRTNKFTYYYKLSNILVDDFAKLKISKWKYCQPEFKYIEFNYKGEYISKATDFRGTSSTNYNKSKEITIYFDDIEDVERVINAIMHMAKLSGAKENKQMF